MADLDIKIDETFIALKGILTMTLHSIAVIKLHVLDSRLFIMVEKLKKTKTSTLYMVYKHSSLTLPDDSFDLAINFSTSVLGSDSQIIASIASSYMKPSFFECSNWKINENGGKNHWLLIDSTNKVSWKNMNDYWRLVVIRSV